MATIALYANKINNMPGLIKDVKKSVNDYKSELTKLKNKALKVNKSICNLDDVIHTISATTKIQEEKAKSLESFKKNSEQFIEDTARIDSNVADIVNQRKDDFYNEYSYLKPECEKNGWEKFCSGCKKAWDWCKEHWKKILTTVIIVIGAVLAIVAVVYTGGMALAPLLAGLLTTLGMASGTALTVATITSLVIAGIAITSTIASSTLNLVDTWGDMSKNSTFQSWKTAMNWTSAISNGFYSIGSIYNAFHGISNTALREYGRNYMTSSSFRSSILNANKFNFSIKPNTSVFWTGMRKNGKEHVAKNYVQRFGGNSLETILEKQGFTRPCNDWNHASSSMAMKSAGEVKVLIGSTPRSGSIWNTVESVLLNINPYVTGIKEIYGVAIKYTPRVFQIGSLLSGLGSIPESVGSILNIWSDYDGE